MTREDALLSLFVTQSVSVSVTRLSATVGGGCTSRRCRPP